MRLEFIQESHATRGRYALRTLDPTPKLTFTLGKSVLHVAEILIQQKQL